MSSLPRHRLTSTCVACTADLHGVLRMQLDVAGRGRICVPQHRIRHHLALPRWDRRFIIHSDASTTGIGAVLCQENDDGLEQPISYYGRVLTPAESRYTVSELELLALVQCIKVWRAYLWSYTGKPFLAVVDHGALLWLSTAKDTAGGGPASRLNRWYLQLQEYNFEVKHRPGKIHHDADMISRMQGNP